MKSIKLGFIPSPDLPAELTTNFIDELPHFLRDHVDDSVRWTPEIVVAPLVGSAEYMNQLMDKAVTLKQQNNWDYVICLTDLPHFMNKHVVMADVNLCNHVALISIPSFGAFPMKQRTKRTICYVLNDMHHENKINATKMSRQVYRKRKTLPFFIERIYLSNEKTNKSPDQQNETTTYCYRKDMVSENQQNNQIHTNETGTTEELTQEDTKKDASIRYLLKSILFGNIRILAGMTFANRPWTALVSFKKVLMLAFGTGIYMMLFPTPWELSTIYSIPRFILLMIVAILSMVTWIIFAHNLWEKPTQKGDIRLRRLYNYTTISTLSVIILINYIVLYCLFLTAIGIFVPPELFKAGTKDDPSMKYYFQLVWLITSLGTLAGSIGTTSEEEEKIRQITYSYRQINRYYEIQDENNDQPKQKTT